jgi:hypothetical protein
MEDERNTGRFGDEVRFRDAVAHAWIRQDTAEDTLQK